MTYEAMARAAEETRAGALMLTRPDGRKLHVTSLPLFDLTNLTVYTGNGSATKTCSGRLETLRAVRAWYEGASDQDFGLPA